MTSGAVHAFRPSTGGFGFGSSFPAGAGRAVTGLPVIGATVSQDATRGLCGGLTFAARDLFDNDPRLRPPGETAMPADGSVLFDYLVTRFLASLGAHSGWANVLKLMTWIQTPDLNTEIPVPIPGLAWRMVEMEWPDIKADIDSGHPSPLFLVLGPQGTASDFPVIAESLSQSHQVLAYAYDLDSARNLTLRVYDPNDPGNDRSAIALNVASPDAAITITAPGVERRLGSLAPIRGIFRAQYAWADPVCLAASPCDAGADAARAGNLSATELGLSLIGKVAL